jgi:hypothetical protein
MDYIDPAPIPPRDEPIKPLSPEEVEIAVANYQANVMSMLMGILKQGKVPTFQDITQNQETIDLPPHENQNRTDLN